MDADRDAEQTLKSDCQRQISVVISDKSAEYGT